MAAREVNIESSWQTLLEAEFADPYMSELGNFLRSEKQKGKRIYPPGAEIFAAFDHTPVSSVKVVIIGQDPYHGPDQAHGLCFSVKSGIAIPPSLRNIFQEINDDLNGEGHIDGAQGLLTGWARQGVLLLNSVLTVQATRAGSHQGRGWEKFTDAVVAALNEEKEGIVFLLWGSYAQKKGAVVDRSKHFVLEAPHPSPLSAHRGFFGCGHFSKTNAYLTAKGETPIDWFQLE
ncbi:MAG: uracil-DNA glycosylase [Pseudomonadales bacterium]|nr:uracil-DNA glycosylase [Pseudomonadales bacterium]